MDKRFQRVGSKSNAQVGRDFEKSAQAFFASCGLSLEREVRVEVGVGRLKKEHSFDLGCHDARIIVECKSHKWTSGGNVPSAKLTVWNEAMYYLVVAPTEYRKILCVLYEFSKKRGETLGAYYLRTYKHLIPGDVELWEYNETTRSAAQINVE